MVRKVFKLIFGGFYPFKMFYETKGTQTPITLGIFFYQKILRINITAYWPMHRTSVVTGAKNVVAGVETCPGYMPGCYIQAVGKIKIGDYTQISANVGLITANHDIHDNSKHIDAQEINIGEYCWIGMNSTVLPGVHLGDFVVVGAGSVVTKSFAEGYCVVAGNPAKIIRHIDRNRCVRMRSKIEYNGYIPSERFLKFRENELNDKCSG